MESIREEIIIEDGTAVASKQTALIGKIKALGAFMPLTIDVVVLLPTHDTEETAQKAADDIEAAIRDEIQAVGDISIISSTLREEIYGKIKLFQLLMKFRATLTAPA